MFKLRLVHILFLAFSCSFASAQNGITGNPDWQIKPAVNTGFVLLHRANISHLVKGYPTFYELNVSKPTLGNTLWHLENNKPDLGISFQFIDLKNPQQLGYAFAAAPYLEIPLSAKEKMSRVVMRLSFGAAYLSKPFEIHENPKNTAIGSSINAYVQFKWFWQLKLSKNLRFEPGFAFTHTSNGKTSNPNLGLNMLSLNFALNVLIPSKNKPVITHIDSSTKAKSKHEIVTIAAWGFNEKEVNGDKLPTFVFSNAYQRNIRNTHKWSLGLDIYYDELYFIDYKNEFGTSPEGFDKLRISARIGYSYNVGRISFPIEVGYYIYQKANPDATIVSRIGVRYYSSSGIVAHFGLRTHYAVAYTFEYGLGYRFVLK